LRSAGRRKEFSHFQFNWEKKTGKRLTANERWLGEDALRRYLHVPFKAMFFLTSEDRLANAYISEHWQALSSMSAATCDIYAAHLGAGDDDGAYRQMQTLTNVPGVQELKPRDLPCLLIWGKRESAAVSLRVHEGGGETLTARLRDVFSELMAIGTADMHRQPVNLSSAADQEGAILERVRAITKQMRPPAPWAQLQHDIFISYKRRVRDKVQILDEALRQAGFRPWYDRNLEPGAQFQTEIAHHLRNSKTVLVAWTPDAFPAGGDKTGWVRGEALIGRDRKLNGEGGFIPVLIEATDLDPPFNTDHVIDLSKWCNIGDPGDRQADPNWISLLAGLYPFLGDIRQRKSIETS
jgi:TIR domain